MKCRLCNRPIFQHEAFDLVGGTFVHRRCPIKLDISAEFVPAPPDPTVGDHTEGIARVGCAVCYFEGRKMCYCD